MQVQKIEDVVPPGTGLAPGTAFGIGQIAGDIEVGEEPGVLEGDADSAFFDSHLAVGVQPCFAVETNMSAGFRLEPAQGPKQAGLAGAAGTADRSDPGARKARGSPQHETAAGQGEVEVEAVILHGRDTGD